MPLPKSIYKYDVSYQKLYRHLYNTQEPLEYDFPSEKAATTFRFRCYGFVEALKRAIADKTVNEGLKEDYRLMLAASNERKIKKIGSKLIFVRNEDDRKDYEASLGDFLDKLGATGQPEIAEHLDSEGVQTTVGGVDALRDLGFD